MAADPDDDGTRAMLELRRSRAYRMFGTAVVVGGFAAWWIKKGWHDKGDTFLIWAPGGIAIAVAVVIAIGAIVTLVSRPEV